MLLDCVRDKSQKVQQQNRKPATYVERPIMSSIHVCDRSRQKLGLVACLSNIISNERKQNSACLRHAQLFEVRRRMRLRCRQELKLSTLSVCLSDDVSA